jgi:hypothetical protein
VNRDRVICEAGFLIFGEKVLPVQYGTSTLLYIAAAVPTLRKLLSRPLQRVTSTAVEQR